MFGQFLIFKYSKRRNGDHYGNNYEFLFTFWAKKILSFDQNTPFPASKNQ